MKVAFYFLFVLGIYMMDSFPINAENNTMISSSEWQVFKEPYNTVFDDGTIFKSARIVIKRKNDSLTIKNIKMSRLEERTETFQCTGDFDEFKFVARRFDIEKQEITQTYIVYVNYPSLKEYDRKMSRLIAKDIESALLKYPPGPAFNHIPVNKIVFDISDNVRQPPKLVTAEELIHG